jgi:hypothetical protein
MVGKYLNGYDGRIVPPGWTDFEGLLGRFTYRFYGYTLNVNARLESPPGYQTDEITARSQAFIQRRSGQTPFFLWVNYVAPHTGRPHDLGDLTHVASAVPATRHRGAFLGAPLPRPPSFDEADVSDKPPAVRRRPPLKQWRIAALAEIHRQRLASLLAVDEGVERIVATLRESGELARAASAASSSSGTAIWPRRSSTPRARARRSPSTGARCCARRAATARSCSRARRSAAPTGCRASPACARPATSTSSTSGGR